MVRAASPRACGLGAPGVANAQQTPRTKRKRFGLSPRGDLRRGTCVAASAISPEPGLCKSGEAASGTFSLALGRGRSSPASEARRPPYALSRCAEAQLLDEFAIALRGGGLLLVIVNKRLLSALRGLFFRRRNERL